MRRFADKKVLFVPENFKIEFPETFFIVLEKTHNLGIELGIGAKFFPASSLKEIDKILYNSLSFACNVNLPLVGNIQALAIGEQYARSCIAHRIKRHFERTQMLGQNALIQSYELFGNEIIPEKELRKRSYIFEDFVYAFTYKKEIEG